MRSMLKYVWVIGFIALNVCRVNAQEWLGYNTSNYAGINAVQYNPALITQTNYGKFDISLIAGNVHVENNYIFANSITITDPVNTFQDPQFKDRYLRPNIGVGDKEAMIHANVQSPAFLLQITGRDAIGFCVRPRVFVNADHVERQLARLAYEELDYQPYWNQTIHHPYMGISANAWMEYDFSYARTFVQNDRFKFKGGVTFKLLQGLMAAGIAFRDFRYNFYNSDTLGVFNTNVQWGVNNHLYNQSFVFDFSAP